MIETISILRIIHNKKVIYQSVKNDTIIKRNLGGEPIEYQKSRSLLSLSRVRALWKNSR
jgi:hypothetical protein